MREIDQILYSAITGSTAVTALATGGVWRGVAPGSATYPYISFMEMTSADDYSFIGRTNRQAQYQIKCIDHSHSANVAGQIATLLDTAMMDYSGTTSMWFMIHMRRRLGIEYEEYDGNDCYQHVGGLYDITVREIKAQLD
jgi:hypothetical protein